MDRRSPAMAHERTNVIPREQEIAPSAETWASVVKADRRLWVRAACEGAAYFLGLHLYFHGFAPAVLAIGAIAGALVGAAWRQTDAGTFLTPIVSAPTFALLQLGHAALGIGDPVKVTQALLLGFLVVVPTSALIGTVRPLRQPGC
jgi:hypothetical protein